MKPVVSFTPEKNWAVMIAASEPYRKKSYHSMTVPTDEARMTMRSFRSTMCLPSPGVWVADVAMIRVSSRRAA